MTMKWRPNDLRVANILRRNFSEKEIDENFRADIDRREFPEIIGFLRSSGEGFTEHQPVDISKGPTTRGKVRRKKTTD